MPAEYWLRQTADQPLFPDILWSRPENRTHAGKLLIIGGSSAGFTKPADAYGTALKEAGSVRVILPDSLFKTLNKIFPEAEFAPSTPSGSFGREALATWVGGAMWADGLLLAGDFGKNSETAILLESLVSKFQGLLTLTDDALDAFIKTPCEIVTRPNTLLVTSMLQLQRLVTASGYRQAVTSNMDLPRLAEFLHNFTTEYSLIIVVEQFENIFVASNGQVSSTKGSQLEVAKIATWWLQNPTAAFKSISTSLTN